MTTVSDFLNSWGGIVSSLAIIIGAIFAVGKCLVNLSSIQNNIEQLPDLIKDVKTVKDDIKVLSDNYSKLTDKLNKVSEDLEAHALDGELKNKLVMDLARQNLLNEIEKAIENGWVSVNKKTVLSELYEAYRENGGNGCIHDLWTSYMRLPNTQPSLTEGNE